MLVKALKRKPIFGWNLKSYSIVSQLSMALSSILTKQSSIFPTSTLRIQIKLNYTLFSRNLILTTLYEYGLRGQLPRLLQNYLTGRFFRVRIGGHLSSVHTQDNGIPRALP